MNKKDSFIKIIQEEIFNRPDIWVENYPEDFEAAKIYFEAFKGGAEKEKPAFTENGKMILQYMKDNNSAYNNLFKAKEIGEGLNITSRTASGAMRKLVTDGYIERMGENPVIYALTEKGIEIDLSAE